MKFVIIGGQAGYGNRGSEAMVFGVIYEIRKKYPNSEIWVSGIKTDHYNINAFMLDKESYRSSIFEDVDIVYDVSGFCFGDQFGFDTSQMYLSRINNVRSRKCKMILLPQSFGPFRYKNDNEREIIISKIKDIMTYPVTIYSREEQGYNDLVACGLSNVNRSLDLVLRTENPTNEVIYKITKPTKNFNISNGIAIIPNEKVLRFGGDPNLIYKIYKMSIARLLSYDYNVYLINHCAADVPFCQQILENILRDIDEKYKNKIVFLNKNLDCIDLLEVISKMEFVISSRYHGVIHSYKSGVPAILIGWAEKYKDVALEFGQGDYFFDIREDINVDSVLEKIKFIRSNLKTNRTIISSKLSKIPRNIIGA